MRVSYFDKILFRTYNKWKILGRIYFVQLRVVVIKYHLLRVNRATLVQIISVISVNNILSNRLQLHEINKFSVRIKRICYMFSEYITFITIYASYKMSFINWLLFYALRSFHSRVQQTITNSKHPGLSKHAVIKNR